MATFEEIIQTYHMDKAELTLWIRRRWIRPQETTAGLTFDDVDRARIELIRELNKDFAVDNDALDLVLSLLDQLYAARQILRSVENAIERLPTPLQSEIRDRLNRLTD